MKQYVYINFSAKRCYFGVPQVSVIGSHFFPIYINDLLTYPIFKKALSDEK